METVIRNLDVNAKGTPTLPTWCNVYEGLTDHEIAAMEQTILQRADLSRPSESSE